jgi:hypothetical protein
MAGLELAVSHSGILVAVGRISLLGASARRDRALQPEATVGTRRVRSPEPGTGKRSDLGSAAICICTTYDRSGLRADGVGRNHGNDCLG